MKEPKSSQNMNLEVIKMAKYERPEYVVELSEEPFELRKYEAFVVMEYSNESDPEISNGFGTLFRYISSDNKANQKISMTVPVFEEVTKEQMKMAFVVPKKHWKDVPEPNSKWLSKKTYESGLFGVVKYGGRSNELVEKDMKKKLDIWIESKGYRIVSNYILAFYNPPFIPGMFRRNEIMVRVDI